MTKVTMKAVDTLHISSVQASAIQAGERFDVLEADAKSLEDRGLAKRVGGAKAESAPANKAEAAPANKAISSASVKVAPARKGK